MRSSRLKLEANQWAILWKQGHLCECKFDELNTDQISILVATNFQMAAMTFAIGTGLAGDNVASKTLCRLSDEWLNDLTRLLAKGEGEGKWLSCTEVVMILLLEKTDGGRRPISLFLALMWV